MIIDRQSELAQLSQDELDDRVIDIKLDEAAKINTDGSVAQIAYIIANE